MHGIETNYLSVSSTVVHSSGFDPHVREPHLYPGNQIRDPPAIAFLVVFCNCLVRNNVILMCLLVSSQLHTRKSGCCVVSVVYFHQPLARNGVVHPFTEVSCF
jgi:hypothetical protein